MWFTRFLTRFPDGVRGIIYSYLRHPCADLITQGELCLRYVYMQHLPLRIHNTLRPSTLGTVYYGNIQRVNLSVGEKNRMKMRYGFRV